MVFHEKTLDMTHLIHFTLTAYYNVQCENPGEGHLHVLRLPAGTISASSRLWLELFRGLKELQHQYSRTGILVPAWLSVQSILFIRCHIMCCLWICKPRLQESKGYSLIRACEFLPRLVLCFAPYFPSTWFGLHFPLPNISETRSLHLEFCNKHKCVFGKGIWKATCTSHFKFT